MKAHKKNEKPVSANYELVSDSKSRYIRKRCGNIFDSPCLTAFLFIILLCSVAYLIFGISSSKNKLDFLKKSKKLNFESSIEKGIPEKNFSENILENFFSKNMDIAKKKCVYDVEKFKNEPSSWSDHSFANPTHESFRNYLQSTNIFSLRNGKISVKSHLFCTETQCAFSNKSLTLKNQHITEDEKKYFVLKKCKFKEVLWHNSTHNEERILLERNFSFNDSTFRYRTKKEFIKIKCLIQEISQGNEKNTYGIEESLVQIPNHEKESGGLVKNMFGSLFGRKAKPETDYDNVILLIVDSVSKKSFYKNMKKTHEFFSRAGHYEMLHGFKSSDVNITLLFKDQPIIWDQIPDDYRTLIAADNIDACVLLNYYKNSQRPPTSHILTPFWISIKNHRESRTYKNIPSYRYAFDYLQEFFNSYENKPKFAVGVFQKFIKSKMFDEDLENFLSLIQKTKDFSKTTIFMTGGAGKETKKFEEYPFALVVPSKKLQDSSTSAIEQLRINSNMETDYQNIRHTIMKLVSNEKQEIKGSLFDKLPTEKLCRD